MLFRANEEIKRVERSRHKRNNGRVIKRFRKGAGTGGGRNRTAREKRRADRERRDERGAEKKREQRSEG